VQIDLEGLEVNLVFNGFELNPINIFTPYKTVHEVLTRVEGATHLPDISWVGEEQSWSNDFNIVKSHAVEMTNDAHVFLCLYREVENSMLENEIFNHILLLVSDSKSNVTT
jgi:hypothetical protein